MDSLVDQILGLLNFIFTPSEISQIKTNLGTVVFVWALVEWRTAKRFKGVQDAIEKLTAVIKKVEESDTSSTKLLNDRLERQTSALTKLDNFMHRISTRLTVAETKAGIIPAEEINN